MLGPGAKLTGKGQPVKRPVKNGERQVSPVKLPTGLGSGKLVNMRNLNLSCCVLLDDDAVIGLTKALPKLQVCTNLIFILMVFMLVGVQQFESWKMKRIGDSDQHVTSWSTFNDIFDNQRGLCYGQYLK